MGNAPGFGSMKARRLRSLLQRELGYTVDKTRSKGGSHRRLVCEGRPDLTFAFHDGDEIGGTMVRTILVRGVGLTLEQALEVVMRG